MTIDDTRADGPPTLTEATPTPPRPLRWHRHPTVGGCSFLGGSPIVVVLLLVGGLGFAIGWVATPDDSNSASSAASEGSAPSGGTTPNQGTTPPSTTTPPASTDPSASALRNLGLRQSDVGPTVSVALDSARQQRHQRGHVGSLQRDLSERDRNARRASRSSRSTRRPTSPSARSRSCTRTRRQPSRPSPSSTRLRPNVRARRSRARPTRTRPPRSSMPRPTARGPRSPASSVARSISPPRTTRVRRNVRLRCTCAADGR